MKDSATFTARVSSKGQIAIPKPIRDQLGLKAGTDLAVRVEGGDVVLQKVGADSWREWRGKFEGVPLLEDLAEERRRERESGCPQSCLTPGP